MKSSKYFIASALLILILSALAYGQQNAARSGAHQRLLSWMSGSFSSFDQSRSDSSYFDIRLQMVPIWPERSDGCWIYVEQAVADYMDQPYRQRVYHLTQLDDSTFESAVFSFKEPLRLAGDWKKKRPLEELTPDSLTGRKGCAIILQMRGDTAFVGATKGKKCASSLSGASYATSEVVISNDELYSWDRGFDSADKQVWGAEKGGYIFKKVAGISEAKIIANLQEDMVKLDQAFIPALAFSEQGQLQKTQQAMKRMLTAWDSFREKYYDKQIGDPAWKNRLDTIGVIIGAMDAYLDDKPDLDSAHRSLETLKSSLTHLRERYGIVYYIDYLNEFHETMAAIIDVARGKKLENLSSEDIAGIKELYFDADLKWKAITEKRFDDVFFGFDEEKLSLMSEYMALEAFALGKLGQALESDDNQKILQAAIGIKPNFAKLYKLFGDFSDFE